MLGLPLTRPWAPPAHRTPVRRPARTPQPGPWWAVLSTLLGGLIAGFKSGHHRWWRLSPVTWRSLPVLGLGLISGSGAGQHGVLHPAHDYPVIRAALVVLRDTPRRHEASLSACFGNFAGAFVLLGVPDLRADLGRHDPRRAGCAGAGAVLAGTSTRPTLTLPAWRRPMPATE